MSWGGRIFFFQAEDGIRDGHVTGVQTCALPILGATTVAFLDTHPSVAPERTSSPISPAHRDARRRHRRRTVEILGMKKRGSRRGEKPRTRAPQRLSHSPHKDVRRRPTLPHPPECSTIGAVELSYRVRNR